MVKYKKLISDADPTNVDSSEAEAQDNLLSSFEGSKSPVVHSDDEDIDRELNSITDKLSDGDDDRLRQTEINGIDRAIQESISNAGSSSSNSNHVDNDHINNSFNRDLETGLQPSISQRDGFSNRNNSSGSRFSMNSIKNDFNFFDRLFKKTPNMNKIGGMGQGSENDGVFNNLSAKPDSQPIADSDQPPTYEEAAADATPPYWESSVLAQGFPDEIFVDGLPIGNIINFVWNLLVSASFQFVGFLLTYILHTSHAAKQGSRAGLGVTFMSYGYYMIPYKNDSKSKSSENSNNRLEPARPDDFNVNIDKEIEGSLDEFHSSLASTAKAPSSTSNPSYSSFLAYFVICCGAYILLKSLFDYHRAKQMERVILQPPNNVNTQEAEAEGNSNAEMP